LLVKPNKSVPPHYHRFIELTSMQRSELRWHFEIGVWRIYVALHKRGEYKRLMFQLTLISTSSTSNYRQGESLHCSWLQ
jgi:hypothetical protein